MKDLKNPVESTTRLHALVTPISGLSAHTSDNLISHNDADGLSGSGYKPTRRILTPVQAAELLECDDKTITRWARQGYIPAHPIGQGKKKYWRFFEDELIDWLTDQKNEAAAA